LTFPTASASVLGRGKLAGLAIVLLTISGYWVIAALPNNQWSYALWGENNVNALLAQPFINYDFPGGC
jgi:ABC-type Na+ efflux pump permease subunit